MQINLKIDKQIETAEQKKTQIGRQRKRMKRIVRHRETVTQRKKDDHRKCERETVIDSYIAP